jgi:hypothetical protein
MRFPSRASFCLLTGHWALSIYGDKLFDNSDFVTAFTGGGYEGVAKPGVLKTVPEPATSVLVLLGICGLCIKHRRQQK